jgi:hypothetical protein
MGSGQSVRSEMPRDSEHLPNTNLQSLNQVPAQDFAQKNEPANMSVHMS